MKKNKISSYLLTISIFTFAATFFYIVQNSYDSLMKPINEVKQSVIIRPIDPNLDISTLDEIEKRMPVTLETEPTPTETSMTEELMYEYDQYSNAPVLSEDGTVPGGQPTEAPVDQPTEVPVEETYQ